MKTIVFQNFFKSRFFGLFVFSCVLDRHKQLAKSFEFINEDAKMKKRYYHRDGTSQTPFLFTFFGKTYRNQKRATKNMCM